MKKKIFGGIAVLAIAAAAAFNVNMSNNNNGLSDLALANVEALASEATGNTVDCYSESSYKYGNSYYDCGDCTKQKDSKGKGNKRTCTT